MDSLELWTIYDHPTDHPDYYVARKWIITDDGPQATNKACYGPTLDDVRAALPPGLYRIAADPNDDPVILETWI